MLSTLSAVRPTSMTCDLYLAIFSRAQTHVSLFFRSSWNRPTYLLAWKSKYIEHDNTNIYRENTKWEILLEKFSGLIAAVDTSKTYDIKLGFTQRQAVKKKFTCDCMLARTVVQRRPDICSVAKANCSTTSDSWTNSQRASFSKKLSCKAITDYEHYTTQNYNLEHRADLFLAKNNKN